MCSRRAFETLVTKNIKNDNVQNEYYLTDIIAMAASDNVTINTMQPDELYEIEGVNDRKQR